MHGFKQRISKYMRLETGVLWFLGGFIPSFVTTLNNMKIHATIGAIGAIGGADRRRCTARTLNAKNFSTVKFRHCKELTASHK